jgi:hypothetical protein
MRMSEESRSDKPGIVTAIKMPKFAKTTVKEFENERKELAEEVIKRRAP